MLAAAMRRLEPAGQGELAGPSPDMAELFRQSTRMGLELCDASGALNDASAALDRQTDALHAILTATEQITAANAGLSRRVTEMSGGADDMGRRLSRAVTSLDRSVGATRAGIGDLARSAGEMDGVLSAAGAQVAELKASSASVQTVAREIQLLAVNAGVEAARHGVAGRGFAVIAEAVKKLADQTRLATTQTDRLLSQLAATMTELRGKGARNLESATGADAAITDIARDVEALKAAEGQVAGLLNGLEGVLAPISGNAEACANVLKHLQAGSQQVDAANQEIQATAARLEQVVRLGESMNSSLMSSGVELPISALIDLCVETARTVSQLFEDALRTGKIGRHELFDETYRPVPGSNPVQHVTAFTSFTDSVLPALQEAALGRDRRIAFCAAVDRNGYLPTHNARFSQPQGSDPVWNAQHARNRRIFDDRTGLTSARNTRAILLQTYRRDMGGGQFVVMNELASPITVGGRHWGGLRLAFKP
jgi:methyl-accepting chemotaxis protein